MANIDQIRYKFDDIQKNIGFIDLRDNYFNNFDRDKLLDSIDLNKYYKVTYNIYLDYIVLYDRMIKFLTDEGYIIDLEILNEILINLTGVDISEIDQNNIKKVFYKETNIITKPMILAKKEEYFKLNSIEMKLLVKDLKNRLNDDLKAINIKDINEKYFYLADIVKLIKRYFSIQGYIDIKTIIEKSKLLILSDKQDVVDLVVLINTYQSTNYNIVGDFVIPFNLNIIKFEDSRLNFNYMQIYKVEMIKKKILEIYEIMDIQRGLEVVLASIYKVVHISNDNKYLMLNKTELTLEEKVIFILIILGKESDFNIIEKKYLEEFQQQINYKDLSEIIRTSKYINILYNNQIYLKKEEIKDNINIKEHYNNKNNKKEEIKQITRKGKKLNKIEEEILNYFLEKNRPIHYSEVSHYVSRKLRVSESRVSSNLRNMNLINNGKGMYALSIWGSILPEEYNLERKTQKQILESGHNINKNYYIKYCITETIIKDRKIRIPSSANYEFEKFIKILNLNNEEYIIEFREYDRNLINLDGLIHGNKIYLEDIVVLEIIDNSKMLIFHEKEYNEYINGDIEILKESKENYLTEEKKDLVAEIFDDIFLKE